MVRALRDAYSLNSCLLVYMIWRVGGGVEDFDAIEVIRCAAS
jgi:predicted phage gp36 major capsid-like protein